MKSAGRPTRAIAAYQTKIAIQGIQARSGATRPVRDLCIAKPASPITSATAVRTLRPPYSGVRSTYRS